MLPVSVSQQVMIEIDKRISEFCDAPLQTDIEILLCHACKVETQILV